MDDYQKYIHASRYARWKDDEGRRETWEETVSRYMEFWVERFPDQLDGKTYDQLYHAILHMEIMPSMRCLMTAGKALARDEVAGYNCAYMAVEHPGS